MYASVPAGLASDLKKKCMMTYADLQAGVHCCELNAENLIVMHGQVMVFIF
jgi:hypothetical protein